MPQIHWIRKIFSFRQNVPHAAIQHQDGRVVDAVSPGGSNLISADWKAIDFRSLKKAFAKRVRRRSYRRVFVIAGLILLMSGTSLWYTYARRSSQSSHDLVFDNVSLPTVLVTIERKFNTTISYAPNQVVGCSFTGTFVHINTESQLLNSLAASFHIRFHRRNDGSYAIEGTARCQ